MAKLADEAYGSATSAEARGWHAVSALELSMKPANFGSGLPYRFEGGVFEGDTATDGNANALVLTGLVDGKRTLVVAFRGTDTTQDIQQYFPFYDHYETFAPLIKALKNYTSDQANGIQQVLVTGHSLGGAMVQLLMAEGLSGVPAANTLGFTWGSPGAEFVPSNEQILNFAHASDPIPQSPLTDPAGSSVRIFEGSGLLDSHSMVTYLATMGVLLSYAADTASPFYTSSLAQALRSGTDYQGENLNIRLGDAGSEQILPFSIDNWVLAGAGDDVILLDVTNLVASGDFRIIDGGAGRDLLNVPGSYSSYNVTALPNGFLITDKSGNAIARTSNIEEVYIGGRLLGPDGKPIVTGPTAAKVINNYISGATVFSDDNGDGQLDPTEASTTTDASGSYTLDGGTSSLVAFGGVNTSTGLSFKGQLSAPSGSAVITPLTTLMALLATDPQAEQKVLSSFGLSSSIDLNTFDPIAAAKAGSADGVAVEVAHAKVYDTVSLIASTLVAAGGDFSSGVKEAFAEIAAAIGGSGISLTNEAQVSALVTAAAQSNGLVLGQGAADSVAAIIVATNTLLDQQAQSGATGAELLDAIAAIERVVQGTASNAIQQSGNDPDQLQALVDAFTGDNLDHAVSTALEHLGTSDTTAPTLTPVADQTNEATSAAGATAVFAATALDNVDGTLPSSSRKATRLSSLGTFSLLEATRSQQPQSMQPATSARIPLRLMSSTPRVRR